MSPSLELHLLPLSPLPGGRDWARGGFDLVGLVEAPDGVSLTRMAGGRKSVPEVLIFKPLRNSG